VRKILTYTGFTVSFILHIQVDLKQFHEDLKLSKSLMVSWRDPQEQGHDPACKKSAFALVAAVTDLCFVSTVNFQFPPHTDFPVRKM
jgi:hypothetical protein